MTNFEMHNIVENAHIKNERRVLQWIIEWI